MSDTKRGLLDDLRRDVSALGPAVREAAVLRWQLAQLELQSDLAALRRLAIVLASAAVVTLSALPLLLVALAEILDGWLGLARAGWLLVLGLGMLASAFIAAALSWSRFRSTVTALRQTREELAEDLVWINEWLGHGEERET